MHVFVDTNFFIQFKPYDAVNWADLFHEDVFIIIPRTVLKEIDNHKNSENKRKSRRARSAVSLIRELINAPKEIQRNGFLLKIGLIDSFDFSVKKKHFLNLEKADDCIVNEILVWAENNPGNKYCVLTGDIGLSITCRDCDVQCYELQDSWKLPPEADDRDNKIKELEKELALLRGKSPILTIGVDRDFYDFDLKLFSELSDAEVETLSEKIFEAFPEKKNFEDDMIKTERDRILENLPHISSLGGIHTQKGTWYLPTKKHIEEYHKKYLTWKREVIAVIKSLSKVIRNDISTFPLKFTLENTGAAPAEDVHVKIFVSNNMLILPDDEERKKIPFGRQLIDFPKAPCPPKKRFIDTTARVVPHSWFNDRFIPQLFPKNFPPREIDKFYWEPEKPKIPVQEWEFSCPEFRHKIAKEIFDLDVLIPESGLDGELYIEISVYSRQLTTPLVKRLAVRPQKSAGNFFQRILKSVDEYIDNNSKDVKEDE